MCNCKLCNWLKGFFGKKCNCEEKGCCEEKKIEEAVVPENTIKKTNEEVSAPIIEGNSGEEIK